MQTFANQAQLTYKGITTNSNVAKGKIVEVLALAKEVILPQYVFGEEKTHIITLVNSGTVPFLNLTVTDDMGAYEYKPDESTTLTLYPLTYVKNTLTNYSDGELHSPPEVDVESGTMIITGVNVPAEGETTLIYHTTINEFAPLGTGGEILNNTVVSGGGLSVEIATEALLETRDAPHLEITKSVCPKQVPENGTVSYVFDILNFGNTDAAEADNVTVIDTFVPVLSDIQVFLKGVMLEAGNYSYDPDSGEFSTSPSVITVDSAVYARDIETGRWSAIPGEITLEVSGTI